MKALVAGWFSFEQMGATAGDLMARDLACEWLAGGGHAYDVALAAPFTGGVDWRAVDPRRYSHVVFVCGPFGNGGPVTEFLQRFAGRRLVGLDLVLREVGGLDAVAQAEAAGERIGPGDRRRAQCPLSASVPAAEHGVLASLGRV